jgi:DNA-directed RNA polymerase subunit RPC12/RpoP
MRLEQEEKRMVDYKCWQCGKKMKRASGGRCETCELTKCLTCNSPLIKLQKILEGTDLGGDMMTVCTNKTCYKYHNLDKLKGAWKKVEITAKMEFLQ